MGNNRFLTENEIEFLFKFSVSAHANIDVLLCTSDDMFAERIGNLFSGDESVTVSRMVHGTDVLIACGMNPPDVILFDEMSGHEQLRQIIASIGRFSELEFIDSYCYLREGAHEKRPEWGAEDYFTDDDIDRFYTTVKMSGHSGKKKNMPVAERRWPRIKLDLGADIEIYSLDDPDELRHGHAVVTDISRGGLYLSNIDLTDTSFSNDESFILKVVVNTPPLEGWHAKGAVIRLHSDQSAGVKFMDISKQDQLKIAALFDL